MATNAFIFLMARFPDVKTPGQLDLLKTETYFIAVFAALLALGLAFGVSQLIRYEPNGADVGKRKAVFWVLGGVATLAFFFYEYIAVRSHIVPGLKDRFIPAYLTATVLLAVLYFGGGFLLAKLLKNNKFGGVFPSRK